ncbi:hypothetical protein H5U35_07440 [Candidatus Aerophobetes bacterium]|nr:hypothetical protein [Candidatus Aerophobetes bacterium]
MISSPVLFHHAPCNGVFSEKDTVQPDIFFIFRQRLWTVTQEDIKGTSDVLFDKIKKGSIILWLRVEDALLRFYIHGNPRKNRVIFA